MFSLKCASVLILCFAQSVISEAEGREVGHNQSLESWNGSRGNGTLGVEGKPEDCILLKCELALGEAVGACELEDAEPEAIVDCVAAALGAYSDCCDCICWALSHLISCEKCKLALEIANPDCDAMVDC